MTALAVYLFFGLALAWRVLPEQRGAVKCWLGLVFGCVALMWLPCLFAFFWGFTLPAQRAALALAALGGLALLFVRPKDRLLAMIKPPKTWEKPSHSDLVDLLLALMATCFCAYLLHTHVILEQEDGSLWVGQSTYGDLAMHLGFIESLYQQGTFPPDYSIYPGQQLDYPFLVDAASASLRFFGLSLRMSVIVPSLVMLFCVFYGFWLLAWKIVKRLGPVIMAWLLFTCNGGFGFCYFFGGAYSFSDIFTGYYTTPPNLVDQDIRWVNVICDMLIPQRTTMAGWCVVLAAIFLLITALEKTAAGTGGRKEFLVLAVTAGAMPMIHTHSFLALGVLSAAWFFCWLPACRRDGRAKALVQNYVLYGAVCLALALPQLILWTFDSVGGGNMLQWNLGWVAEGNWFFFWVVNCGVVFIAMWPMLLFLRGEKARLFIGAAAVFLLANVVAFQPNLYDNNKLLYIWFMVTDILVCDWLWEGFRQMKSPRLRAAVAGLLVFLGTFSGILSMLRETVSEYQLLSGEQTAAAEFIVENTPADSLFLTATVHTNPVSVLTGRNILCGPGLYLYYHGVSYQEREAQVAQMYSDSDAFEEYTALYGVDYVYIGSSEYANYDVDYDYFAENYDLIYQSGTISIFQIS